MPNFTLSGAKTGANLQDALEEDPSAGGLQSHLPISFLYRHSIELYLKSCIVIFHRRFNTAYQHTDSGEAAILVGTKPKFLKDIHALMPLYTHLKSLINMNIEFLSTLKNTDWVLTPELDIRVKLIDGTDSSSTFFRYPVTKDKPKDKQKSTVQPKDWESMVKNMHNGQKPVKAFLFVDDDYNVIEAFNHDDENTHQYITGDRSGLFWSSHDDSVETRRTALILLECRKLTRWPL